ncbi:MAG TPA: trypsin-like peptidase domain-containing protein [Pirellulaceae bacterium]|nr:trypsin-like peptidase domain-containing protein [Pirellulaceae bacterium]
MRRGWPRSLYLGLAAAAAFSLAFSPPLMEHCGRAFAAEVAPADSAATDVVAAALKTLFAGGNPAGVADLKAMQTHVQKLTEQLKKCTVGVTVGMAQGSGVIVSKDGYVLTAAHVAGAPNSRVEFMLSDGKVVRGKSLGLFRTRDAGLMKITDPGDYPFAEMGSSTELKNGQWCLALGHPGGYQEERGMVLRVGRVLLNDLTENVIVTDCTLVGGDSGGPLFDMDGHVIGINSRIAESLTSNMHVPVSTFKETWDRLKNGEDWGHLPGQEPWLGVRGDDKAKDALIAEVVPGSPADDAGIKKGDVIISYDGEYIPDFAALKAKVSSWRPTFGPRGSRPSSTVQVLRGGEVVELRLRLRPRG